MKSYEKLISVEEVAKKLRQRGPLRMLDFEEKNVFLPLSDLEDEENL